MNTPTIPARVALDAVCSILDAVREELRRRQAHGKAKPGRSRDIAHLTGQLATLGPMLNDRRIKAAPEVDAAVVGLLAAWTTGHMDSLAALEEYLAAAGHPAADAVAELQPTDYAGAVRLLLLERGKP